MSRRFKQSDFEKAGVLGYGGQLNDMTKWRTQFDLDWINKSRPDRVIENYNSNYPIKYSDYRTDFDKHQIRKFDPKCTQ